MAKTADQKKRILYVAKFILENYDEEHPRFTSTTIQNYLSDLGIDADRRTILSDIAAVTEALELDVDTVERGGFYLRSRQFDYTELCLIAECIYAAKFVSDQQAQDLIETVGGFGSENQKEALLREVLTMQRVQTGQKGTMGIISTIREAIRTKRKIRFKYLKRSINHVTEKIERFHGRDFTVSPYKMFISDGYYYVLAYSDMVRQMRFYRIDRMSKVEILQVAQMGIQEFRKMDLTSYARRVFFMSTGETTAVSIRFELSLLDAVVDRLGDEGGAMYRPDGKKHFVVHTEVDISPQFFGWLCSFGAKAQILQPPEVAEQYRAHLFDIINHTP